MPDYPYPNTEFLTRVISVIEDNLADETFGVEELAVALSMSRSSLLRKIKSMTNLSVSVLIREVRLYNAKELLRDISYSVSDIAYKVGFNSTSYFTKCYREQFGYPPGEEGARKPADEPASDGGESNEHSQKISADGDNSAGSGTSQKISTSANLVDEKQSKGKVKRYKPIAIALVSLAILVLLVWQLSPRLFENPQLDKSIAVLPFKNDSDDSANTYFMNGLMEAVLNRLEKIEDLDVTSRTTVEKYRDAIKSIPELSDELEVSYFIEGSGQKIDDQILLTVQLIEARSDRRIWSQRYESNIDNVFEIQIEIAKKIAGEVEAIITPEEILRIEEIPTENMVAYDLYLRGQEKIKNGTYEGLVTAIDLFAKAVNEDPQFAQAYAYIAIGYYFVDLYQVDKRFALEINTNADKALLHNNKSPESLVAKALSYMQAEQYDFAVDYFERALEITPNSGWIHNFLSDIYTSYSPDTEKYLKHAIKGLKSAIAGQDSASVSFTYMHISNALAQTGFIDEAESYILKSMAYNPNNHYSEYIYTYIKLAKNFNLVNARKELTELYAKDTTRLDVIQELAKVCYTMKDYKAAWQYYSQFTASKEAYNLDIYPGEDIKIAYVLLQTGKEAEAQKFLNSYREYAEQDDTKYKNLSLSAYSAVVGEVARGIDYFKKFAEEENFQYWFVLFLDKDQILSEMAQHPEFMPTVKYIKDKFWAQHKQMRKMLEEEGLDLE